MTRRKSFRKGAQPTITGATDVRKRTTGPSSGSVKVATIGPVKPNDDPVNKAGVVSLSAKLRRRKKHQEVVNVCSRALSKYGYDSELMLGRALSYMALNDFTNALFNLRELDRRQAPHTPTATLSLLSRCCLLLGEPERALEYVQATMNRPDVSARDTASLSETSTRAASLQIELDHLRRAWQRRSWKQAQAALRSAHRICEYASGTNWTIWGAEVALACGDMSAASNHRNKLSRFCPVPKGFLLNGLISFLVGDLDHGLEQVQLALRGNPTHAGALELLRRLQGSRRCLAEAKTAQAEGRLEEALQRWREMLDFIGEKGEEASGGWLRGRTLVSAAEAHYLCGEYGPAENHAIAAFELEREPHRALWMKAKAQYALRKLDDAHDSFRAARLMANEARSADAVPLAEEEAYARRAVQRGTAVDCYEILVLDVSADDKQIKAARGRQLLKYHPDKGSKERDLYADVNEAYAVLSDSERRRRYDSCLP